MTDNTLLVYCEKEISPRVSYTLQTLLREMAGIPFTVTNSPADLFAYSGPAIAYGNSIPEGIPFIPDAGLLNDSGTGWPCPEFSFRNDRPILFSSHSSGTILPFDLFSASFWLLSRYEEYQPFTPDTHGRFPAEASLMGKAGLLHLPLVDIWMKQFTDSLLDFFPSLSPMKAPYRFVPTIDVDSAWAYLHKPLYRQAGGVLKDLFNRRWKSLTHRISVLSRLKPDPFDTWKKIAQLHEGYSPPILFFLLGKYGKFNKNQHPGNRHLITLIQNLGGQFRCGIHPSYESGDNYQIMKDEAGKLSGITGQPVTLSRQHFLRFFLPETYRNLIKLGIRSDFSMGFAGHFGFRAGTCSPFRFYDIHLEEETPLMLFPLTVMDGTLSDYMHLSPPEAIAVIKDLAETVMGHQGVFVSLWHNESIGGSGRWEGWDAVYAEMLALCHPDATVPKPHTSAP